MDLISWNIQWGRGCDGRVDLARTVATLRDMADADVLCLQEVSRGFPELRGTPGRDQVEELEGLLPDYEILFAPGVDRRSEAGTPRQFGNLIATRLPVREVFRRPLPWPVDPHVASMPRVALEVTLLAGIRPVRIICTHLEYYSERQRTAQAEALRSWHEEACQRALHPAPGESYPGPFTPEPRPQSAILCGDFNARPDDVAYQRTVAPFDEGVPGWRDAWLHTHPDLAHAPTCGLYDKEQWPEAPFACDFMFVTEDLEAGIERCEVNAQTDASDHQPVHLTISLER